MAKDIIVSGSAFLGVEQINFAAPNGGKATFVDADTKNPQAIVCSVSCKLNDMVSFARNVEIQMVTPKTTNSYVLEE